MVIAASLKILNSLSVTFKNNQFSIFTLAFPIIKRISTKLVIDRMADLLLKEMLQNQGSIFDNKFRGTILLFSVNYCSLELKCKSVRWI